MKKRIWVTWDDHRRSRELAKAFDAEYFVLSCDYSRIFRYVYLVVLTCALVVKRKPKTVFCQNPSIFLASFLSVLKVLYRYKLIVDRHSNFKFDTESSNSLKWRLFHCISNFSLKKADLTIVTNSPLAKIVEQRGGRSVVLPDKLPSLSGPKHKIKYPEKISFLFICTFSYDEPVLEVLNAFVNLGPEYGLYVTGNYSKFGGVSKYFGYKNINFLGFVSEEEYVKHLFSCNATITLTSMPMTLNCGSYESVVANKPQILSNSDVIKDYFCRGACYVRGFHAEEIERAVLHVSHNISAMEKELLGYKSIMCVNWKKSFIEVENIIVEFESEING